MSNPIPGAHRGHLFVVAAPSGAGKTTLIEKLMQGDPSLVVSVSHTTRPKRASETDGIHYHFVDDTTFASLRDADEFLEWARVFDHAYGTSRDTVIAKLDAGRDVILEIDWQGAAQVRQALPGRSVHLRPATVPVSPYRSAQYPGPRPPPRSLPSD